jgi:1-acyl-sn-glycerol-3-phosphate acyltransferase
MGVGKSMRHALARETFRLAGWKVMGDLPASGKYVVCGAPHTSNWDFFIFLAVEWYFGVRLGFMAKHTIFRPPLGWILRGMGGIPIDRRSHHDVVAQVVGEFAKHDNLAIVVPAEGTRARADYWKSGFYFMAKSAGVPIILGTLDFAKREVRFIEKLTPGDSITDDMDKVRKVYAEIQGKFPDRVGPIRLRAEEN